eukprot:g77237.t1
MSLMPFFPRGLASFAGMLPDHTTLAHNPSSTKPQLLSVHNSLLSMFAHKHGLSSVLPVKIAFSARFRPRVYALARTFHQVPAVLPKWTPPLWNPPLSAFGSQEVGPFGLWDRMFDWDEMLTEPVHSLEEKEKEYQLQLRTPTDKFPKEHIEVTVQDGVFTVKGKYSEEKTDEEGTYNKHFESFSRSVRLPENVDQDKIKANCKDGMLKVTFPKKEVLPEPSMKKIRVEYFCGGGLITSDFSLARGDCKVHFLTPFRISIMQ